MQLDYNTEQARVSEKSKIIKVDARGLQCPGPIAKVFEALNSANYGDIVEVLATDPGFSKDISSWCSKMGYNLLDVSNKNGHTNAKIEKVYKKDTNNDMVSCLTNICNINNEFSEKKKATMVVFSGDLDKAIASFIIATGAASMGKDVTMFFTFWGLNILRKSNVNIKKQE